MKNNEKNPTECEPGDLESVNGIKRKLHLPISIEDRLQEYLITKGSEIRAATYLEKTFPERYGWENGSDWDGMIKERRLRDRKTGNVLTEWFMFEYMGVSIEGLFLPTHKELSSEDCG